MNIRGIFRCRGCGHEDEFVYDKDSSDKAPVMECEKCGNDMRLKL